MSLNLLSSLLDKAVARENFSKLHQSNDKNPQYPYPIQPQKNSDVYLNPLEHEEI